MDIKIEEYLSEDEIKEIAKESLKANFHNIFNNEKNIERILVNTSYEVVYKMVDSVIDDNLDKLLSEKVEKIISEMTVFNIFKEPNAWDKNKNSMYSILERELISRKSDIGDVIVKSLQQAPKAYCRAIGQDAFSKIVSNAMRTN